MGVLGDIVDIFERIGILIYWIDIVKCEFVGVFFRIEMCDLKNIFFLILLEIAQDKVGKFLDIGLEFMDEKVFFLLICFVNYNVSMLHRPQCCRTGRMHSQRLANQHTIT